MTSLERNVCLFIGGRLCGFCKLGNNLRLGDGSAGEGAHANMRLWLWILHEKPDTAAQEPLLQHCCGQRQEDPGTCWPSEKLQVQ